MAVTVLNSPRAVEMSLYVVRAFVRMREVLATHKELAKKLEALEKKTEALPRLGAVVEGERADEDVVFDLLEHLHGPAGHAADGEDLLSAGLIRP